VADLDVAELLKQQLSGGASLRDSVTSLAQSDPKLAPIVEMLAQREEQLQQDVDDDEQAELLQQQEAEELADRRQRASALREQFAGIAAEVDGLRAKLGDVAAALGACPACFGDDRSCPWCRGRGGPGFMPPDPDGFDRLVMPALRLHVRLHGRRITEVAAGATHERSAS
jgi:hypothetical protein